jgi:hypothetical protein
MSNPFAQGLYTHFLIIPPTQLQHWRALGACCYFLRVYPYIAAYPRPKKCDLATGPRLVEGDTGVQPCHTPVHANSSPYFQHFQLLNLQKLPHPRSGGVLLLLTGIPVYSRIPESEKV